MAYLREAPEPDSAHMKRSAKDVSADGVAQPVSSLGDVAQPTSDALPGNTPELTVGFYNVEIEVAEVSDKEWKIKERLLKQDIVKAFDVHALDVLCLSELG